MTSGSGYVVDGQTHYQRNKEVYLARNQGRREVIRQYLRAKKLASGCVDCGFNAHPDALDFDHVGLKTINPSRMISRYWGTERIDRELAQCEVRCANCHRIKTAERASNMG